ncbi:Hsp20/alpha crystallin family protein [Streptomyces griseoluteus]|uniref:Hsp20/alpha crystallin family protein n=1 Tax=Streptomyces griseoluteus TaxID=29306 RepID=A0A4Z1D842_STRGP|nr:Hsp20/alpha crystallin family protein [Streptomyces griseoluteus]TGN78683.1 Hsp20/alpha crystallin family protein [Streptomyces griseoluteus]GHE97363.1 molecular chaperone Hsp20 [Streptomyces griseoluteus]
MSERAGVARSAWWAGHDPVVELQQLWGEVSRLVEQSAQPAEPVRHWMPLVEEEDAGDAYLVRAELPGIPRESVNIEVDGRELHIHGSLDESTGGNALRRREGSFSYGVRVPGDVNVEGVQADLSDGVLTVRLPKSQTATRRSIEIGS